MDPRRFLAALRQRLQRVLIADGLARLIVGGVVLVAVLVGADYLFRLPALVRVLVLTGLVAALGVQIWRRLQRPLSRPMDDATLARFAERRIGGLGGRLVSAVEGLPLTAADHAVMDAELGDGATRRLVPAQYLSRRVGTALGSLAVAALILVAAPGMVMPGLQRLFLPLSNVEWARASSLVLEVDRAVVPADEPVVVSVTRPTGGEASVRLTWTDRERRTQESRLVDGSVGAIARRQPLTLPPGSYRITAESGDALPVSIDVRVVARPVLDRIAATLMLPEYTGREAETLATLACTALPGSRLIFDVSFRLDSGRTVDRYALMLGDHSVPITATATGFRGELTIEQGGELLAVIADQDGIGPRPEPRFTIRVSEDRPPLVRLGGMRNNEAVSARAQLSVHVDARDDHGLADLRLRAAVTDGVTPPTADAERDLVVFTGVGGEATTRRHGFEVGTLAKAGQRVVLVGVASDHNTVSGPGVGRSEPLVVRVVSDEDLRLDLDRQLVEALERVRQAREDLSRGMADEPQLGTAARNALLSARKAGDLLSEVRRRAQDNRLDNDLARPVGEAADAVNDRATPDLAKAAAAGAQGGEAARTADAALAEAERQLQGLRQEGDLSRLLAHLIQLQRNLGEETGQFIRTYLVKAIDDAGLARATDLAGRQRAIGEQVREIERRLLAAGTGAQFADAQALIRREHPADRLAAAAAALGASANRAKAPPNQDSALAAMEKLLELLRGSDANRALAERVGALADRQERLQKELERGADPRSLTERQKELQRETRELADLLDNQGKEPAAKDAMRGAERDEGAAAKAMESGDASAAAREAAAAAAQLREAQRQLQGQPPKPDDKQDQPTVADVLRILRELRGIQVKVLNGSQAIHDRIGEAELDFAAKRDLDPLAELEIEIALRLRAEVLPPLERMPIAKGAIERVAAAVDRVVAHLATPALGERGIILEKIALHELSRLLAIVDAMPQGKPSQQQQQGGGEGQQAPFPPAAELALLTAMQEEVARRTVTGAARTAEDQKAIADLVELLRQNARPGSRPAVLLERASRATASAEYRLRHGQRGLTTRHEQELAVATLRRILEEAEAPQGGGSPPPQQQPQQQRRPAGDPSQPQPQQNPGGEAGEPGDPSQGGDTQQSSPDNTRPNSGRPGEAVIVVPGQEGGDMHLPPERREQLRQALEQHLPPQALPLYRRYLELLEEQP